MFSFLRVCQNYDKKNQKEETTGMRGITRDEIRKIVTSLEEVKIQKEIQDMIRVSDTNGNGYEPISCTGNFTLEGT